MLEAYSFCIMWARGEFGFLISNELHLKTAFCFSFGLPPQCRRILQCFPHFVFSGQTMFDVVWSFQEQLLKFYLKNYYLTNISSK